MSEIIASLHSRTLGEPVEARHFIITSDPDPIFLGNDTRVGSFVAVRDREPFQLLVFFSRDLRFDVMIAEYIKFRVYLNVNEILTLFCSFPTIDAARRFFRLVRGGANNIEVNVAMYALPT